MKFLPDDICRIVSEFSKPLTRPDWKRNPKLSFEQFYDDVKKSSTRLLVRLSWKIQKGYSNEFIHGIYKFHLYESRRRGIDVFESMEGFQLDPRVTLNMVRHYETEHNL